MAYPTLNADFFVSPDGVTTPKAPPLTPQECRKIYDRDGMVCTYCGDPVRRGGSYDTPHDNRPAAGCIDHIFPRSRGGQNDPDNLCVACKSCNSSMKAKI